MPELPDELALPEFMGASGGEAEREAAGGDPTPPFFKYMRVRLASVGVLDEVEDAVNGGSAFSVPQKKARLKVTRFLNRLLGLPMVSMKNSAGWRIHCTQESWKLCGYRIWCKDSKAPG